MSDNNIKKGFLVLMHSFPYIRNPVLRSVVDKLYYSMYDLIDSFDSK